MDHLPQPCSVFDCALEASRWFDANLLFGRDYPLDTYYLRDVHADHFAPDDEAVHWLEPSTAQSRTVELAVYSCRDGCIVCD